MAVFRSGAQIRRGHPQRFGNGRTRGGNQLCALGWLSANVESRAATDDPVARRALAAKGCERAGRSTDSESHLPVLFQRGFYPSGRTGAKARSSRHRTPRRGYAFIPLTPTLSSTASCHTFALPLHTK